ncbi:flagellar hook-associated protein FlgL [Massilia sp. BJB1822]|uniref:flagellar hook-associated protein FlgL n=1 Tax=Massilia sp. BJB1822 TaxID=2744470 RepID=UPI00280615F0|nr:flagellar hook-associated protein FlgL [Massilia sp. BJB1822]
MNMRVSSRTIFETGLNQLTSLQSQLSRTQQQLATGRRVLTAADDPVASARALEVTQSKEMNDQFKINRQNARASMSHVDLALGTSGDLLKDIKTLIVNAGNPAQTQKDRDALVVELEGRFNDLLGQANTADGNGNFLFAGYRLNTQPFTQTPTGAVYSGDQGQRDLQVGSGRQLSISESGAAVFEGSLTGNGTFETKADPANKGRGGSGVISPGSVTDITKLTGHQYALTFSVVPATPGVPAQTSYTVMDTTTGVPVTPAPVPYKSGEAITFDGIQFDVKGDVADQDVFTVDPSKNQSVFTTVRDLITAMKTAGDGPTARTDLTNKLNNANQNINNALDNVLSVRAKMGAGLKELDYLDNAGDDVDIQYQTTLSKLIEVDPVVAISMFTQQQMTLEAAQKSYKNISGLSLFNYI